MVGGTLENCYGGRDTREIILFEGHKRSNLVEETLDKYHSGRKSRKVP